jgi:hypothetical protein
LKIYLNENEKSDEENKKEYICWKNYAKNAFQSELRKIDWARMSELNLNEKAKTINECLLNTVNNLLLKKIINSGENNKWYAQEQRELKKEKNKCYDEIGNSRNWESYKKICSVSARGLSIFHEVSLYIVQIEPIFFLNTLKKAQSTVKFIIIRG